MANFFQDLIKKVMPDELEYKLGITPQPKTMTFRVGEGLKPEQKTIAEKKVEILAREAPSLQENFFAGLLRATPRSIAATTLKVAGKPGEVFEPAYGKGITPAVQKFIFGEEAVKRPEGAFETGLEAFGAIPFLPGGILKQPAKAGIKKVVKEVIEPLGKKVVSKIPQELQPLAQEARKYKSAEEFVQIMKAPSESEIRLINREIASVQKEISAIAEARTREARVIVERQGNPLTKEQTDNLFARFDKLERPFRDRIKRLEDSISDRGQKLLSEIRRNFKTQKGFDDALRQVGVREGISFESQLTDFYTQAVKGVKPAILGIPKELEPLAVEARKFKSAEEFVNIKRPPIIREIVDIGGNPVYHDTSLTGLKGILKSGEIKPSKVYFQKNPVVSVTRDFDNYSRYADSPYRLILDEKAIGHKGTPYLLGGERLGGEAETIFSKSIPGKSIKAIGLNTSHPQIASDLTSGKLNEIINLAKSKEIKIEFFDGKKLMTREVEQLKAKSQLTDFYTQAVKGVEKVLEPLGKRIISKIPKELEPLAQEAKSIVEMGGTKNRFGEFANVTFKEVPSSKIRNGQIDDYFLKEDGGIEILISKDLSDLEKQKTKIHALIEANYLKKNGISFEEVTRFDAKHKSSPQPGDRKDSPYFVEHQLANKAEKLFSKIKSQPTDFYNQATKKPLIEAKVQPELPVAKTAVNIERLNIPQEAKQKIIKVSEEIKPQLEEIKGKILSNDEVIESAQSSEILRRTTNRETTLKSEAALLRTRQHLAELAKNEKLTPEFIDTLRVVSAEATKRGRELQALGIEADPALGTIKTKLIKQLIDMGIETEKIIKAAEGIDFNNTKQVTEFYRKFVKPTLPEIIDEYRYINMLSSPKTQIVNTFSNILQAVVLRPATRLASGVVDNFAHILTGKEQQFYIKQVPSYYKGAFNSFGDALSEALKVMRGQQQIYRPDVKNIPTGLKILKPFQIVPKLMEASDVFFRKIITGGEVEALMSKGVKEAEAVNKAAKTAEELVFRKALDPSNKTGQGALLSRIDALTTAVYKLRDVPGVKWFIPFVQTPMNILKQGIEYSPLGFTTLAGNTQKIEQFGKTLVGTTVFAGAGWLALKDKTTWAVPINKKEKDAFYASGQQPYSIKVGDNWVSYSRLGPLAYPIAMAAAIKFYTKDNPKAVGDSEFQKTTKILSGIAQFFSDQSYVQGIGDFVNLAQGDVTALTRAASQIPSQLIPLSSLQRWVANIIDPVYRKTEKKLSIEGIIENLKSGIPGLTATLPPYTTPAGEESKRPYPFFNPISPVSVSKESPEWKDYFNTLQQVSRERTIETKSKEEMKQSAQDLYDKMKILPKDEAKRQFDDLAKKNPDLAKEISNLAKETKLDYKESFLKSLGVENGQRARYIVQELNKLSKEEKRSFFQNLINKKVITKQVNEQILQLLNKQ